MLQKFRPNPPRYPAKLPTGQAWQRQTPHRRPASLPAPSYGGGRPPNPDTRPRIYAAIVAYASEHGGHTPTRRELVEICHISSTSVVNHHIHVLIDRGELELIDGKLIVAGGTWLPPHDDTKGATK